MISKIFLSLALLCCPALFSQNGKPAGGKATLVVGIVIDQMRNDFIYRYWDRFGEGGFCRLVKNGYYFSNAHYNYAPTYTGPGHASIFTGATPRVHGIIANEWFSRKDGGNTSCVFDPAVSPVGTGTDKGRMSPSRLRSTTIGDEMKLASGGRSKVFAVSLKDRGAVLPGGHDADGAFWYGEEGNFVSSSWYMKELPAWVKRFNERKLPAEYLAKGWEPLYPLASYTASLPDNNAYENRFDRDNSAFPYSYKKAIEGGKWSELQYTPYGNSIVRELALACIKSESLGGDDYCDLLAISFSATDILGHAMGPRSAEIEDMYLRLDKEIETLLNELDNSVGRDSYILFLTSDHGVADVPAHLNDRRIPAGYVYRNNLRKELRLYMQQRYGDSLLISSVTNDQVFLSEERLARRIDRRVVELELCDKLLNMEGIAEAYPSDVLKYGSFPERQAGRLLQEGYNHALSGNIAYVTRPGFMDHGRTGTTHGSVYDYDTHVPLVFYGRGIKKGESGEYVTITRIAATLSALLKMNRPGGCSAEPLDAHFR